MSFEKKYSSLLSVVRSTIEFNEENISKIDSSTKNRIFIEWAIGKHIYDKDDIENLLALYQNMNSDMVIDLGKKLIKINFPFQPIHMNFLKKYIEFNFKECSDEILENILPVLYFFTDSKDERIGKIVKFILDLFGNDKPGVWSYLFENYLLLLKNDEKKKILKQLILIAKNKKISHSCLALSALKKILSKKNQYILELCMTAYYDAKHTDIIFSKEEEDENDFYVELFYLCLEYMDHDFTEDKVSKFIIYGPKKYLFQYLYLVKNISYADFVYLFFLFSTNKKSPKVLVDYFTIDFSDFLLESLLVISKDKYVFDFVLSSLEKKTIHEFVLNKYSNVKNIKNYEKVIDQKPAEKKDLKYRKKKYLDSVCLYYYPTLDESTNEEDITIKKECFRYLSEALKKIKIFAKTEKLYDMIIPVCLSKFQDIGICIENYIDNDEDKVCEPDEEELYYPEINKDKVCEPELNEEELK